MTSAPPAGWTVEFDAATRILDGGRVLAGGTPFRLLRLTEAGARLVDRLRTGAPVPGGAGAQAVVARLVGASLVHPVPPAGPGPWQAEDVTVVIPVRGPAEGVARALSGLSAVLDRGEVVVVDDGSTEPSAIRAVVERLGGTVVRHERSLGPAAARNTGWRMTTRPIVAFVDADVVGREGWLDLLLAVLGDADVVAVAPRIRAVDGGGPRWLSAYDGVRSSLDLGAHRALIRRRSRVSYVPTTALVVRRDALERVGGFDEELRVGEDVDLVWRLSDAAGAVRYEPAVEVEHPTRSSLADWLRQRFRYGTAAADLAARHGDAVAPLELSGWSGLTWLLAGIGRPALASAVGLGSTAALAPRLSSLDHPARAAARLGGLGHLHAARAVADALRRPWWPVALVLAWRCPRSRPALAAVAVLPGLMSWWQTRPAIGPARHAALHLADDIAYGTGVWIGCIRRRSVRALLPTSTGSSSSGCA